MFAYSSASGDVMSVFFVSNPIAGFHLIGPFDMEIDMLVTIERFVQESKSELRAWLGTYMDLVKSRSVSVILHCGDGLRLGHALQQKDRPIPLHLSSWRLPLLRLIRLEQLINFEDAFDIIDTSDVLEYVGVLNVLSAVVPLLKRGPRSALHMEAKSVCSADSTNMLPALLCADVDTLSIFLGLAPRGHLVGLGTDLTNTDRVQVEWRVPGSGDSLALELDVLNWQPLMTVPPEELAGFFFDMCLKMFAVEGAAFIGLRHYNRTHLVMLMLVVKRNVETDWQACVTRLVKKIKRDKTCCLGRCSVHELTLWLHMHKLYQNRSLNTDPRALPHAANKTAETKSLLGILFDIAEPQPVIWLALQVPHKKLSIFTKHLPKLPESPALFVEVTTKTCVRSRPRPPKPNRFAAIQCFFGKLKQRRGQNHVYDAEEDLEGWSGSADLIVHCAVPAYCLLHGEAQDITFALHIISTPETARFQTKLGIELCVFRCGLADWRYLKLLRAQPTPNTRLDPDQTHPDGELDGDATAHPQQIEVILEKHVITQLRTKANMRVPLDDLTGKESSIKVHESTPCSVTLDIGSQTTRLIFPCPIDARRCLLDVSHEDGQIEVSCPISSATHDGGYGFLPVTVHDGDVNVWGGAQFELTQHPKFQAVSAIGFEWLKSYLELSLSPSEARNTARFTSRVKGEQTPLLNVKLGIRRIFLDFVQRMTEVPKRNFRLCLRGDPDTIIHIQALHHDRNTGSVVLDGYVMCVSRDRELEMTAAMHAIPDAATSDIKLSRDDKVLWKQLIPVLVERCRRTWDHQPDCPYFATQRVPLSVEHGESPICRCGEGKETAALALQDDYRAFASYATRIALMPLQAVASFDRIFLPSSGSRASALTSAAEMVKVAEDVNEVAEDANEVAEDVIKAADDVIKAAADVTRVADQITALYNQPGDADASGSGDGRQNELPRPPCANLCGAQGTLVCARCGTVWYCGRNLSEEGLEAAQDGLLHFGCRCGMSEICRGDGDSGHALLAL